MKTSTMLFHFSIGSVDLNLGWARKKISASGVFTLSFAFDGQERRFLVMQRWETLDHWAIALIIRLIKLGLDSIKV